MIAKLHCSDCCLGWWQRLGQLEICLIERENVKQVQISVEVALKQAYCMRFALLYQTEPWLTFGVCSATWCHNFLCWITHWVLLHRVRYVTWPWDLWWNFLKSWLVCRARTICLACHFQAFEAFLWILWLQNDTRSWILEASHYKRIELVRLAFIKSYISSFCSVTYNFVTAHLNWLNCLHLQDQMLVILLQSFRHHLSMKVYCSWRSRNFKINEINKLEILINSMGFWGFGVLGFWVQGLRFRI